MVSAAGDVAKCMRVAEGAYASKTDRNSQTFYLHRLSGEPANPATLLPVPNGIPQQTRANADTLDKVYRALLANLPLTAAHRHNLEERGLPPDAVDRGSYGTLPGRGRARVARALWERFGDVLLAVPGFFVQTANGKKPYITLAGSAGLLIPCLDVQGRIVAFLVRPDAPGDGPKYLYLSSSSHNGPGPGAPSHVPAGIMPPAAIVRMTEGPLKADIATRLSGLPTVAASGVANWRPALDVCKALQAKAVRLSFDADAADKPFVGKALTACAEALLADGFALEWETWDAADGKGIDDLLAAGKAPQVLAGKAALLAIQGLAERHKTDCPDGPLTRLAEVLVTGGAGALFRDKAILAALARKAMDAPDEFAALRAEMKKTVSVRDLDKALQPYLRDLARQRPPATEAAGVYRVVDGCIVRERLTPDGVVLVPLCNFDARIVEEITRDDGAERYKVFALEGKLANGTTLPRVEVRAEDFASGNWITKVWGTRAVPYAGMSTKDHLRCALQLLSGDVLPRTVYGHTGWRRIGDTWLYLHAGGAIGPDGPVSGIEVSLPDPLVGLEFPEPPRGTDLAHAVRASLALLNGLAPDPIMFPLLAAVYRAPLGDAPGSIDLSLHLAGEHGAGKSELAALCQQHYGAGLDRLHLPGNWLSTGNALEGTAFAAKDALIVVDDYAPTGAPGDRQRLEREADRLLRAQGNRSGRQRMRADGSLRPPKPPRGLVLSTGEDVPPGQSLRGRMLVLEVSKKDAILARLTPHQQAAAAGLLVQALAGYVRWLAPQYGEMCERLPDQRAALRDRALAEVATESPRTPGIVANLALGLKLFLDFGQAAGAITDREREALTQRGWQAVLQGAIAHGAYLTAAEPTGLFLRLLAAALASGRAHIAGPDGKSPEPPEAWGWRSEATRDGLTWWPQGRRIGWVDGPDVYLEPQASYAEAHELSREQGDGLPISRNTLAKRLKDKGLLASWDAQRQRNTIRRTLEGVKGREVLHLHTDALSPGQPSKPSTSLAQEEETQGNVDGFGGQSDDPTAKPSTETAPRNGQELAQPGVGGRFGQSDTGGDAASNRISADAAGYGPYGEGY